MKNKQEEFEALIQSEKFGITVLGEIWWDEPCDWNAMLDG